MEPDSSDSKFSLDQQIFQLSQLTEQIQAALALGDSAELESIFDNLAHLTSSLSQLSTQVVKQKEEHTKDLEGISTKKKAVKLHTKYEEDPKVLKHILRSFNKSVANKHTLDFLQAETWKLAEVEPAMFIKALSDEFLEEKILIYDLLAANLLSVAKKD